jgi:hypothetical protein
MLNVRWAWKINDHVVAVADEKGALAELRGSIVDGVHLEAVHVVWGTGDSLQIVCEEAHNGTRPLVGFKWRSPVIWSLR